MRTSSRRTWLLGALVALSMLGAGGAPASAATPRAGFTLESFASPTNFSVAQNSECTEPVVEGAPLCEEYQVTARNVGSEPTNVHEELALTDTLPAKGVTVEGVSFLWSRFGNADLSSLFCNTEPLTVRCALHFPFGPVAPDETLQMHIRVLVESGAPEELMNHATISGGGTTGASVSKTNPVADSPTAFGPSNFSFDIAGVDGAPDAQAGDHPYELATTIGLDNTIRVHPPRGGERVRSSVEDVRDVIVDLPLGFVGSTLAAPECPLSKLSGAGCPADTIVGHIKTEPSSFESVDSPIYNLVPERGTPAEFGYVDTTNGSHAFYARVAPTSSGYVLQTINAEIPAILLSHIAVTFYGDPAARDAATVCGAGEEEQEVACRRALETTQVPFFTNPTDCSGEQPTARIYMDSWQHPARFNGDGTPVSLDEPQWAKAESKSPPVTGCNLLQFTPELGAQPTTHEADKPSGLDFELKQPQSETVGVPATATLRNAVVKFPQGFAVDPSAGDGLAACSEAQIGWTGPTLFDFTAAPPACPEASKIGTLELESPLIPHKLEGEMFLASQNANPFGTTIGLYVVVDDPITGVLIKIAGKALLDPHTGRLEGVFDENPNLPFSDLRLHFFGGPRAEFATPEACGTFTTSSELTPYSLEGSELPATPFDSFVIDEACPGGFSPSFRAGSENLQAGAFTVFDASLSRSDADEELAGLTFALPSGLLGKLAGVPLCSDADAAAASCPAASQVGTVKAGAGPGPTPLFVAGKAYLTGPYNGGPYGLAVVVPAVAGPFDFGTVVVRQSIRIDPLTAQVTDVSDPFPKIIDGIPLRLRRIDVTVDRPGFIFNPTSCAKEAFAGSIAGSPLGAPTSLSGTIGYATQPGSSSPFTTPFQVTNCASLAFKPDFKVSVTGRNSKATGAGLSVRLSYPAGSFGSQANIARVKVELPKQLPSRLGTLQKACLAQTFDANPAACPAASIIGHAKVITPLLADPLEGPVYFVSHGGEEFPSLTIVLHGDGVTVRLVGSTFISKAGITSTTFKTTPDVPFSIFELTLPQGPFSALAANGNLCGATRIIRRRTTIHRHGHALHVLRRVRRSTSPTLLMPTEFTAQNGAQLNRPTRITVTGCAARARTAAGHHRGKRSSTNHT